jgi:hypothetical protein
MRYWNIARQRHYRALSAMLPDLRVSADRAAWSPPLMAENPGFSRNQGEIRRETDCLLEGTGFEPVWSL